MLRKRPTVKKYKILLAEDDQILQFAHKSLIEENNCEVEIAENGKEALSKIKKNHYDLVFMDINMPLMNGIEATQKIRKYELDNNKKNIPIIALSTASYKLKDSCLSSGMNGIDLKPLTTNNLKKIIEKHIIT